LAAAYGTRQLGQHGLDEEGDALGVRPQALRGPDREVPHPEGTGQLVDVVDGHRPQPQREPGPPDGHPA
jgi:hypothetical protein